MIQRHARLTLPLTAALMLSGWIVSNLPPAQATLKLTDQLTATQDCEAFASIAKETNPGRVRLIPNRTYPVLAKNRKTPSHYLIQVQGAKPEQRWVALDCGTLAGQTGQGQTGQGQTGQGQTGQPNRPPQADGSGSEGGSPGGPSQPSPSKAPKDYLLALSWQPSFCETKPTKPECMSQTGDRFDASNLVLHGLWPQPQANVYCGVSDRLQQLDRDKRWLDLPPIPLSPETTAALAIAMPGYASGLHLHEWYKHGTCYSETPEEYYQESLVLLSQVNASAVRELIRGRIGDRLTSAEIRRQFDQAFGAGAGTRVEVACANDIDEERDRMIVELRIHLRGEIQADTRLADLLRAAPTVPAGCRGGEIDRAGFGTD